MVEKFGAAFLASEIKTQKSHMSAMLAGDRGVGDELAERFDAYAVANFDKPAGWFDAEPVGQASVMLFADLTAHEAQLITLYRTIKDPQKRMDLITKANSLATDGNDEKSQANPFGGKKPGREHRPADEDSGAMPLDRLSPSRAKK